MQKYNVLAEIEVDSRVYGAGTTVELEAEVASPLVGEGKISLVPEVSESAQVGVDPALVGAETTETSVVEDGEAAPVEEQEAEVAAAEGAADTAAAEQATNAASESEVKAEEKAEEGAPQGAGWMGGHTV